MEEEFSRVYQKASKLANNLGTEIRVPRIVLKQKSRPNAPSDTPEEHFRRNLYVPLMDWVLEDLSSRFSNNLLDVYRLGAFLPYRPCNPEDIDVIAKKYAPLLGTSRAQLQSNLQAEHSLWSTKWKREVDHGHTIPSNAMDAYKACEPLLFTNIRTMLHILLTLPVSIASAERSFSTLRSLKSYVRSTCGESRLNGLTLIYIHRDIQINNKNVIDRFAAKKNRKIKLLL